MSLRKRILVAEDNQINRLIVRNILGDSYDILEAENGKQALDILLREKDNIVAVLLDIVMPVMTGYEFLTIVRSMPEFFALPIVVMTQSDEEHAEIKALELGATDFVTKPYPPAVLKQRLANIVLLSQAAAFKNTAERDPLTGLYNKQTFFEKVRDLLVEKPDTAYDICHLDIEHFKLINDLYGLVQGDSVLQFVAKELQVSLPSEDTLCARLSGDHFAICIPRDKDYKTILIHIATHALEKYPLDMKLSMKLGIYHVDDNEVPVGVMCDRAKLAIEGIRGNVNDVYASYDDSHRRMLLEEQEILNTMHTALEQRQFEVYFQPKFEVASLQLSGAEALVRWIHPQMGMIPPDKFIPLFEKNGFVSIMDEYVWEETCRWLQKWIGEGKPVVPISVNVSRCDIYNPNLCAILNALVEKYGITKDLLILEITETAYTKHPEQLISAIKKLGEEHFLVAMDDFGSGYSSLNMLKDTPVDMLKIDLRFLEHSDENGRGTSILSSVVRMAKWLNLPVIAEGVETKDQVLFLRSIGCNTAQGFFFARPMPGPQFEDFLVNTPTYDIEEEAMEELTSNDIDELWQASNHFNLLFNAVIGAVGVVEYTGTDLEIVRANDAFFALTGMERKTFFQNSKAFLKLIYSKDRPVLMRRLYEAFESRHIESLQYRYKRPDGTVLWIESRVRRLSWDGKHALFYFSCNDITHIKNLEHYYCHEKKKYEILNTLFDDDLFEYNVVEDVLSYSLKVDDKVVREVIPDFWKNFPDNLFIHPKDVRIFKEHFSMAMEKASQDFFVYRIRSSPTENYQVYSLRYSSIEDEYGNISRIIGRFRKIDEELHDKLALASSKQEQLGQLRLLTAMKHLAVSIWEYNIERSQCFHGQWGLDNANVPMVIEKFPESLIQLGAIHEDSVQTFLDLHDQIRQGARFASADVQMLNKEDGYKWCRIKYTTYFDGDTPIRAIGTAEDLTNQKLAEQRYLEENAYREAIQQDLVASCKLNVTKDKIEDFRSKHDLVSAMLGNLTTASEIFFAIASSIPDFTGQELFAETYSCEALTEAYRNGRTSLSIEHQFFLSEDSMHWVSSTAKLLLKPGTSDIIAFVYVSDITDVKIAERLVDYTVSSEYDIIAYIDAPRNHFYIYSRHEKSVDSYHKEKKHYQAAIEAYAQSHLTPECAANYIEKMSLDKVCSALEKSKDYTIYYHYTNEQGTLVYKKVHFSYIDKTNKHIVMTQADVSDVYIVEKRNQEILCNALSVAQQASVVKNEFLSKMSHEIRTPLNAILGLTTIAGQAVHNLQEVENCLSKIGVSARHLLALFNDLIDISYIESNKLMLKKEKFAFEDFINTLSATISPQTSAKGVEYDVAVLGNTEDTYLGDILKLQQILMNILTNAVKFTPSGGKVQFLIQQVVRRDIDAVLRFTVSDTGVGISKEFLPQLFVPFMQEHTGSVSMYGGTGLGLAITQNLVKLMDGTIDVQSIEGEGTTVTIDIKLGIVQEKEHPTFNVSDLKNLNILIVDDDILVYKHLNIILMEMGLKAAAWADSGIKALSFIEEQAKENITYSLVFIDWKMPDMDGIQTAPRLRERVGNNAKIILMTAYDWLQIEQDAKNVGIDTVVNKPLFASSLRLIFASLFEGTPKPKGDSQEQYDFTGKRILLVEDHPLNVEVARKLLTSKQIQIDVANDGLKAVEKFAQSAPGYYDAILMDVRMPVMDGIASTQTIRSLDRPDSKHIPIIAMTANTFDEDKDKTFASGMNAHLSKPIDAKKLYQTLQEFLTK